MCIPGIIPTWTNRDQISPDLHQHNRSAQKWEESSVYTQEPRRTPPIPLHVLDEPSMKEMGKDPEQTLLTWSSLQWQPLPQFPHSQGGLEGGFG